MYSHCLGHCITSTFLGDYMKVTNYKCSSISLKTLNIFHLLEYHLQYYQMQRGQVHALKCNMNILFNQNTHNQN